MARHRNRSGFPNSSVIVWTRLALKTTEMLLASAQVIHHRVNRIAMAGAIPNARDQREFTLMGQEKIEAATESAQALAARMVTVNTQLGALLFRQMLSGASGFMKVAGSPAATFSATGQAQLLRDAIASSSAIASQLSDSIAGLAHHGLKPIHLRATGNAKRLLR